MVAQAAATADQASGRVTRSEAKKRKSAMEEVELDSVDILDIRSHKRVRQDVGSS